MRRTAPIRNGRGPGAVRVLALLAAAACCLVGWAAAQPAAGNSSRSAPADARLQAARRLFERRCSSCHDDDGSGGGLRPSVPQIPDFTNRRWQQRRDDAQLLVSILEGKGSRMPSFRGKLDEDSALDLVTLIRTFDPAYDPAAARKQSLSSAEFDRRFRELEAEMERLKKQFRDASAPPRRP